MEFNPTLALDYARRISRPRQVGSSEEKEVAQEIAVQLERFGFMVTYQSFYFSSAHEVFLSVEILLGQALILTSIWAYGVNQWLSLLQSGLLIILIIIIGLLNNKIQNTSVGCERMEGSSLWSSLCWNLGTRYETKNLIATLPGFSEDPPFPHLYLVAHYDSKSQYLPLAIRIALFVIVIAGSLIFAGLNLLNIINELFTPYSYTIGFIVILCGIPLLFLDYGNDSPGALDDASGVGLVLHLAEVIAKQPASNGKLKVTVLITSAEELAIKGALAYIKGNKESLCRQAEGSGLYVLNFDGIGVDGKLYLVGGERYKTRSIYTDLYSLVKQSGEELGIPIGHFSLPGALFDHIPFAREGFDALSLIGIGRSTWSIHTAQDKPENLHLNGFDQAGRLATRVIEKLSGIL